MFKLVENEKVINRDMSLITIWYKALSLCQDIEIDSIDELKERLYKTNKTNTRQFIVCLNNNLMIVADK